MTSISTIKNPFLDSAGCPGFLLSRPSEPLCAGQPSCACTTRAINPSNFYINEPLVQCIEAGGEVGRRPDARRVVTV